MSSSRPPKSVGHSLILSHAHASKVYRDKYKKQQGGSLGITLDSSMYIPYDNTPESMLLSSSSSTR
jgi:beta-glucosidase